MMEFWIVRINSDDAGLNSPAYIGHICQRNSRIIGRSERA